MAAEPPQTVTLVRKMTKGLVRPVGLTAWKVVGTDGSEYRAGAYEVRTAFLLPTDGEGYKALREQVAEAIYDALHPDLLAEVAEAVLWSLDIRLPDAKEETSG